MTSGGNSINDFPENQLSKPIPASIQYAATANAVYNGQALLQSVNQFIRQQRINSAGLMPTEARGNYLPEPPYLLETKTYHSQPLKSIRHAGNYFVPLSIRPIFIFFVAEVMSNYLTTAGLKKIFSTSGGPPETRGSCHICHMVNSALGANGHLQVAMYNIQ